MRHLIVSREFPPASYPPGGIGTYASNMARLLADAGEVVHVIGERWLGAPEERETRCNGRLVIHRVDLAGATSPSSMLPNENRLSPASDGERFARRAGLLAELLVEQEGIDVIEGQEWEAPLAFFLARRSSGQGPDRKPPVILHLHSPTTLIFAHNEWPVGRHAAVVRCEAACVAAADALVTPSRFLAREAATLFGRDANDIRVIPYAIGDAGLIRRADSVWRQQRIAYVGRFEPRKGVIEFVEAAIQVAESFPRARFDLIGQDVAYRDGRTVREYLASRIPRQLKARFRFFRAGARSRVRNILARARAAIVPSRWDNFPYAAIEAMASGLPVISSPNGGMTEIITDEVNGWIAGSSSAAGLADALTRALASTPERCASMGQDAAAAVEHSCSNAGITRRNLEFRTQVARLGAHRSLEPRAEIAMLARESDVLLGSQVAEATAARDQNGDADLPRLTLRQSLELPFARKLGLMKAAALRPRRAVRWLRSRVSAIVSEQLRRRAR